MNDLFKAPKLNNDNPMLKNRKGEDPSEPTTEALELAHKIKAEVERAKQEGITAIHLKKIEMRHNGLIKLGFTVLALIFSFGIYLVYSDMRIKTKIDTVEAGLINKINSAYTGDQLAHEEIARRIPVLSSSLLAMLTKRAESDSASLDKSNAAEQAPDIAPEKEVKIVVPVDIYLSQEPGAPSLGRLLDDSGIIDINYGDDWSSIMLTNGFPVWIHADFVSKTGPNTLTVMGRRVNLRIKADLSPASVVGKVIKDDELQIRIQTGSWYKVNSPADFKGWVKTTSLKNLLQ